MKKLMMVTLILMSTSVFSDICGKEDDRGPSFDPRVGRLVKAGETSGCSATLISNNCIVTIGSCVNRDYVEFNVPSAIAGVPQASHEKDRYHLDPAFLQYDVGGMGNNWAVIKLQKNEMTNMDAGAVQGYYKVTQKKPSAKSNIKVIAYGYALNDLGDIRSGHIPANRYPDTLHYSQQVSTGTLAKAGSVFLPEILEHTADTSYGSWGAPIINEAGEIIGITTHGGCRAAAKTNTGTSITGSKKFKEAVNKCLSL